MLNQKQVSNYIKHYPVTLIRSVVRNRSLDSSHTTMVESHAGFKFYNRSGDYLFEIEEKKHSLYYLNPTYKSSQVEPCLNLTITPISQYIDTDVDEHENHKPLSLSNILFLEDSLDQEGLPTILEEDPTSEYNSLDNTQHITTQVSDIPNITEPVSITTTDESNPHTNGDELPPIVSQPQMGINNSHVDSDNDEISITESSNGSQFDEISIQFINIFDDTDDYLSAELNAILNH